ncbi:hypothetical protein ACFXJ5_05225 [Streptomyces sp. NPDC059373]
MYSADGIAKRRNGRAEPTEEMIAGLVCSVCRTDYRRSSDREAKVVSHHGDAQLLACEGVCARMASGSVNGVDETPLPLADRVHNYEVGR